MQLAAASIGYNVSQGSHTHTRENEWCRLLRMPKRIAQYTYMYIRGNLLLVVVVVVVFRACIAIVLVLVLVVCWWHT